MPLGSLAAQRLDRIAGSGPVAVPAYGEQRDEQHGAAGEQGRPRRDVDPIDEALQPFAEEIPRDGDGDDERDADPSDEPQVEHPQDLARGGAVHLADTNLLRAPLDGVECHAEQSGGGQHETDHGVERQQLRQLDGLLVHPHELLVQVLIDDGLVGVHLLPGRADAVDGLRLPLVPYAEQHDMVGLLAVQVGEGGMHLLPQRAGIEVLDDPGDDGLRVGPFLLKPHIVLPELRVVHPDGLAYRVLALGHQYLGVSLVDIHRHGVPLERLPLGHPPQHALPGNPQEGTVARELRQRVVTLVALLVFQYQLAQHEVEERPFREAHLLDVGVAADFLREGLDMLAAPVRHLYQAAVAVAVGSRERQLPAHGDGREYQADGDGELRNGERGDEALLPPAGGQFAIAGVRQRRDALAHVERRDDREREDEQEDDRKDRPAQEEADGYPSGHHPVESREEVQHERQREQEGGAYGEERVQEQLPADLAGRGAHHFLRINHLHLLEDAGEAQVHVVEASDGENQDGGEQPHVQQILLVAVDVGDIFLRVRLVLEVALLQRIEIVPPHLALERGHLVRLQLLGEAFPIEPVVHQQERYTAVERVVGTDQRVEIQVRPGVFLHHGRHLVGLVPPGIGRLRAQDLPDGILAAEEAPRLRLGQGDHARRGERLLQVARHGLVGEEAGQRGVGGENRDGVELILADEDERVVGYAHPQIVLHLGVFRFQPRRDVAHDERHLLAGSERRVLRHVDDTRFIGVVRFDARLVNHVRNQQVGAGDAHRQAEQGDDGEQLVAPPAPEDKFKSDIRHNVLFLLPKLCHPAGRGKGSGRKVTPRGEFVQLLDISPAGLASPLMRMCQIAEKHADDAD